MQMANRNGSFKWAYEYAREVGKDWSAGEVEPDAQGYRMGVIRIAEVPLWVGRAKMEFRVREALGCTEFYPSKEACDECEWASVYCCTGRGCKWETRGDEEVECSLCHWLSTGTHAVGVCTKPVKVRKYNWKAAGTNVPVVAESDDRGRIQVLMSPWVTNAAHVGLGCMNSRFYGMIDLEMPLIPGGPQNWGTCLGHDWWPEKGAPYPVYSALTKERVYFKGY